MQLIEKLGYVRRHQCSSTQSQLRQRIEQLKSENQQLSEQLQTANQTISEQQAELHDYQQRLGFIENFTESLAGYQNTFSQLSNLLQKERETILTIDENNQSGESTMSAVVGNLSSIVDDIESTSSSIASLKGHTKEIEQTSGDVRGVAETTNLLSLNANIEEMQLRMDVYRVYLGTLKAESCVVVDSDECGIGRWYYSELFRQRFKAHSSYQAIEAPHDKVHLCAHAVVEAVKADNRKLAQRKLEEMEQYNREVNQHIQKMSENLLEEK